MWFALKQEKGWHCQKGGFSVTSSCDTPTLKVLLQCISDLLCPLCSANFSPNQAYYDDVSCLRWSSAFFKKIQVDVRDCSKKKKQVSCINILLCFLWDVCSINCINILIACGSVYKKKKLEKSDESRWKMRCPCKNEDHLTVQFLAVAFVKDHVQK